MIHPPVFGRAPAGSVFASGDHPLKMLLMLSQILREVDAEAVPAGVDPAEAWDFCTIAGVISWNVLILARVAGPAMPSTARPFFCWKSLTAFSVPEPN